MSGKGLKQKAVRFRVLIIGRANSGKTTILKKICNTTDNPVVYNERGQRVNRAIRVHCCAGLLTSCMVDTDQQLCAYTNPTG